MLVFLRAEGFQSVSSHSPYDLQLSRQKNFARANHPAGNSGWSFSNYSGFRLSSKDNFQLELKRTHKKVWTSS